MRYGAVLKNFKETINLKNRYINKNKKRNGKAGNKSAPVSEGITRVSYKFLSLFRKRGREMP